jgi:serine/threonine protein kinase
MATPESFKRVVDELTEIFNFDTTSEAVEILKRLEYGNIDASELYFVDFVKNLPVLNADTKVAVQNGLPIKMIKGIRRKTTNVLSLEKKSGSWGNVRAGQTYAYKEVRTDEIADKDLNNYYRDVLTEVLIQVILSCDIIHGDKVPKIINIYKQTPESKSITIQMEKYDMTFIDYLKNIHPTLDDLGSIFTDLCTALEYFQETYKFNHKDMKADNLMMKENKIKFIDFGYSILKFNNKQYSAKLYGAYDVLYFSKVQDLLLLSLYLLELISIESGDSPLKIPQWLRPRSRTIILYSFLKTVIRNKRPSKVYTLKNPGSLNLYGTMRYPKIELQSGIVLENISNFRKMPRFFQVGYDFAGQYLNGQFDFPFATPRGFLDLYKNLLEEGVDPDGKYVTSILYPTEDKPKEGGKRRKNRKTMKKRNT